MAEQNAGQLNPRILFYPAESIINWRKESRGSTSILTQVRLVEPYEYANSNDEFCMLMGMRVRVVELRLGAEELHEDAVRLRRGE